MRRPTTSSHEAEVRQSPHTASLLYDTSAAETVSRAPPTSDGRASIASAGQASTSSVSQSKSATADGLDLHDPLNPIYEDNIPRFEHTEGTMPVSNLSRDRENEFGKSRHSGWGNLIGLGFAYEDLKVCVSVAGSARIAQQWAAIAKERQRVFGSARPRGAALSGFGKSVSHGSPGVADRRCYHAITEGEKELQENSETGEKSGNPFPEWLTREKLTLLMDEMVRPLPTATGSIGRKPAAAARADQEQPEETSSAKGDLQPRGFFQIPDSVVLSEAYQQKLDAARADFHRMRRYVQGLWEREEEALMRLLLAGELDDVGEEEPWTFFRYL